MKCIGRFVVGALLLLCAIALVAVPIGYEYLTHHGPMFLRDVAGIEPEGLQISAFLVCALLVALGGFCLHALFE